MDSGSGSRFWGRTILGAAGLVLAGATLGLIYNHRSSAGIELDRHPLLAVSGLEPARFIWSLEDAEARWKAGTVFVDAREDVFFDQGHIPGAISLPVSRFDENFPEVEPYLDKDAEIVCYCSGFGCEESTELAKRLLERGYRRVYVYEGGWPEWSGSGLPVE